VRRVVWGLSIACVGLQVLLSFGMLWTMFELSTYGEVSRRPTYSWAGLVLPLVVATGTLVAAMAAWRARRESGAGARVVVGHGAVLIAAGTLALLLRRAPSAGYARAVLLEPGSKLPPNEIYGSESALGGIIVPLLAVGVLAVPGLLLGALLGSWPSSPT
jgi:hypothetical protein